MLSCIKVLFVESPYAEEKLLGRSAGEYLLREFDSYDFERIEAGETLCLDEADRLYLILPLDMPLVRAADISHAIESMKRRRIRSLALGANTGARICFGGEKEGSYFVSAPIFTKLGSAKSYNVVYNKMRERIIDKLLLDEVSIPSSDVHIDDTVQISAGATVLTGSRIEGNTTIACGATVEASFIRDCVIDEGASVGYSHLVSSRVGARTTVGPFARLRGATVGEECRIGDFVEVKASTLHDGVKAAHLSYIGDGEVGEDTNVGCGTVFCNYDGKNKHRTSVGRSCFIGANVNLIAPVSIGDRSFIAAGTTVSKDIQDNSFTIGRVRQESKIRKDN